MGRRRMTALATVLLLVVGAAACLYAVIHVSRKDRTPPVITMDSEVLEVSVSCTPEDLLEGVHARDNRDGDVTGSVLVENIADISRDHRAAVVYAAFDQAGNVTKATRTLCFTDYESPRFSQNRALVLPEGTAQDVLSFMKARDMLDGDLSSHIKGNLVSDTTSLSYAGNHQVEFRVTNSMGDTVRLTLPVDVFPVGTFNASVELSEYLVYLPRGTAFRPEAYFDSLTVGSVSYGADDPDVQVLINRDAQSSARHVLRVNMDSNVDTGTPGVYTVTYTASLDGTYTGFSRLNVVVEE